MALIATVRGDDAFVGDGGVATMMSLIGEGWFADLAVDVLLNPYGMFQFINLVHGEYEIHCKIEPNSHHIAKLSRPTRQQTRVSGG